MRLECLSAVELAKLIKKGEVSCTEVIRYFADRISSRNAGINAFVYTKIDEALAEAALLEKSLLRGIDPGPLCGVPVALKDFLPSRKGWTNSHGGVKALMREDPEDSMFFKAASAAGAIAVGKTNAPAFAFRGTTDNKLYGPTSTPFNTEYNSGGSSGGSAAAVADGLILIGEGSDGGGSLRIPAAWCGCFGYKASVGTIPSICRPDAWMATHPYCHNGAITKTVEDSAVMLNYMAQYAPRDPLSLDLGKRDFTKLMLRPIKDWKIAFTPDFGIFPVDNQIASIVSGAARKLELAGAKVDEVSFNFKHTAVEYAELWCRSISIDTSLDLEFWKREGLDLVGDHREELPEEFIYWNEKAFNSSVLDYRLFNDMRTEMFDQLQNVFDEYDILISPVTICSPVKNAKDHNTRGPLSMNGVEVEPLIGFCETFMPNFTGHPAASVPCGTDSLGLPVGMQLIGRRFRDEDVFAAAHACEQIMPWNYEIPLSRKL